MSEEKTGFLALAENERWSCRKYEQRPLEEADLQRILRAGQVAPTAANAQPQRIVAINTPEGMRKLEYCTHYVYGAPAAVIVCYDRDRAWVRNIDGKCGGDVDAAIVTTHMMLEAADLGVGTCWVGHFDPEEVRDEFSLPGSFEPVAILDMGYPAEGTGPHPVHWKREPLEATVWRETF